MAGPYDQERGAAPLRLQFRLTLDAAARADEDTVAALLNTFPLAPPPDVSVTVEFMESTAGGAALIILTITVFGPALKWMGKKVMGPPLDEVGKWLRDMDREFRDRRKVRLESITHCFELEIKPRNVSIGVPTSLLEEPRQWFSTLAEQLVKAVPPEILRSADRVMLSWNGERERRICTIWPTNMPSALEYLVYDLKTGQCEKKHL